MQPDHRGPPEADYKEGGVHSIIVGERFARAGGARGSTAGRPGPAEQINAPCPSTREGLGCPVAFIEGRRTRLVDRYRFLLASI